MYRESTASQGSQCIGTLPVALGMARASFCMKKGSTRLVEPCANGCGFGLGEIHGAVGDGLDFFAVTGGDFAGLLVVNAHDVQAIGHFSE